MTTYISLNVSRKRQRLKYSKRKRREKKEEKIYVLWSCRHFMTLVMLFLLFSTSSIKSGKRKLYNVCEKTMKKKIE